MDSILSRCALPSNTTIGNMRLSRRPRSRLIVSNRDQRKPLQVLPLDPAPCLALVSLHGCDPRNAGLHCLQDWGGFDSGSFAELGEWNGFGLTGFPCYRASTTSVGRGEEIRLRNFDWSFFCGWLAWWWMKMKGLSRMTTLIVRCVFITEYTACCFFFILGTWFEL